MGVSVIRCTLTGFGWFLLLIGTIKICVKIFGSDFAVSRYAGSSRNLDTSITFVLTALVFLALSSIIGKLDKLLERDPGQK